MSLAVAPTKVNAFTRIVHVARRLWQPSLMGSLAPEPAGDMKYAIIYSSWQALWRIILNGGFAVAWNW